MSTLTFDGPYDWGYIIVGVPQTFNITYSTSGSGVISNIVITLQTDVNNASINGSTITITPASDWISPDLIKFQNSEYPLFQGDTSNQIITNSISDIFNNYLDTLLYCFEFNIEEPIDKVGSVTATATYTVTTTIPADPTATPPVPESSEVTQETETQIYTFTARKNLDSARTILNDLSNIGITNQQNI